MQKPPRIVAVTGASGYIGTRLLLQLETNLDVGKIVAFDRKPLPYAIHNISFYQRDLAPPQEDEEDELNDQEKSRSSQKKEEPPLEDVLRQHRVETLVHLASAYSHTSTRQDWAEETEEDLTTLEAIQKSCRAAGVKHAIFLTSHAVYGAFADNPIPVTERCPIRSRPGDFLGQASCNADLSLQDFRNSEMAREGNGIKVTILRTCPVLGYSDNHQRVERIFPYRFLGVGEDPPYQFIHEVDIARVLEEVIQQEAEGIFNVAGEGVVFLSELADITRRKLTQLPSFLAYPADWMSSKLEESGRVTGTCIQPAIRS